MAAFLPYLLCLCSWIRGVETFCSSAFLAQVMICGALVWSSSDAQDATGTAGIMAAICPACLDGVTEGITHKPNSKSEAEIIPVVWLCGT